MSCFYMVPLNIGTLPTFQRDDKTSAVDLTWASPNLVKGGNDWAVHDILNMSDHRVIRWAVTSDQAKERPPYNRRYLSGWNANKFDAELLLKALDVSLTAANSAQEETEEVMRRVASVCDAIMARKRPNNDHLLMYWWNDNIAKSRQECIRARRKATRARRKSNRKDFKELNKVARLKLVKVIKASMAHCWDESVEEVEHDSWGRPNKVVMKRMKPQSLSSPTCQVLLERIVTNLFPQQPDLQIGDLNSVEPVLPITLEELKSACSRMGNKKAPGPDGIPNIPLKKAIKIAPEMFPHMYNRCL